MIANGNGLNSEDIVRFTSENGSFSTIPDPPVVTITDVLSTFCHYSQDGSATATASGGTPPHRYTWNCSSTVQSPSNLPPGSVSVTVAVSGNQAAIATAAVPSPKPVVLEISEISKARCFGSNDGIVLLISNERTLPYQALWSNGHPGQEG